MSTTTATEIAALTADDVRALRQADNFSVHLDNGTATLRAFVRLRQRTPRGFDTPDATTSEAKREIATRADTIARAFFYAGYATGQWRALGLLVRAGDTLTFHARTNNNGYLDAAAIAAGRLDGQPYTSYDRLYLDELLVSIVRNGKTIVREMLLAWSVCPDNSARAIR